MAHRKNLQFCRNRFHCSVCNKGFAQDFAKNNHQKLHIEKEIAEEKHPERYKN